SASGEGRGHRHSLHPERESFLPRLPSACRGWRESDDWSVTDTARGAADGAAVLEPEHERERRLLCLSLTVRRQSRENIDFPGGRNQLHRLYGQLWHHLLLRSYSSQCFGRGKRFFKRG